MRDPRRPSSRRPAAARCRSQFLIEIQSRQTPSKAAGLLEIVKGQTTCWFERQDVFVKLAPIERSELRLAACVSQLARNAACPVLIKSFEVRYIVVGVRVVERLADRPPQRPNERRFSTVDERVSGRPPPAAPCWLLPL
jgi:hypothetical protein